MKTARDWETVFSGFDLVDVRNRAADWGGMAYRDGFETFEHTSYLDNGGYEITITARKYT